MTDNKTIEKVSKLFMTRGFKTVTMDEISAELSISKKTLYESFSSKENLIEAVLENNFNQIAAFFSEIMERELNAVEEIISFKNYINQRFNTPQLRMCRFQLQKYYSKLHQEVYMKQRHKVAKIIADNFEKGKNQKIYREEIIPELYSDLFMRVQQSIKKEAPTNESSEETFDLIDIYFDIYIRGMLTEKGLKIYEKLNNEKTNN